MNTKKFFIALGAVSALCVLIIALCLLDAFAFNYQGRHALEHVFGAPQSQHSQGSAADTTSGSATTQASDSSDPYAAFTLPSKIDPDQNPLLYDFASGCLGYKSKQINMFADPLVVLCTQQTSSSVYAAYKRGRDLVGTTMAPGEKNRCIKNVLPLFSYRPIVENLDDTSVCDALYRVLEADAKAGSIQKIQEGPYNFYVLSEAFINAHKDERGCYHGFNMDTVLGATTPGYYEQSYNEGKGFSIDMIRSCCDLKLLYEKYHYDFTNSYWDRYTYGALYIARGPHGEMRVFTPRIKWDASGHTIFWTFVTPPIDCDGYIFFDVKGFDEFLRERGCESLESAVKRQEFMPLNSDYIEKAFHKRFSYPEHPLLQMDYMGR